MNLLRALVTVSGMTLVSRVFGFVRDAVIARVFGAGLYTDAFFVAFRLPNLLRRVFAEGAFSQAFVPILAEYKTRRGEAEAHDLVDHVTSLLALALFVVTALGIVCAPLIIYVSAPGFAAVPAKFDLTVELLRVTFPYILFISLTSLAGGILNTYGRFAIPAFTPTLLNLSFIAFALWVAPYFDPPVLALAWAVVVGGVLQLAFQVPYLVRLGLLPRLRLNLRDRGVWRILRLMGPAIFGVSIGQISLLINTIFASFLVTGSVSWLYYADRLMEFPTGVLGVALGTILLPSLSKSFAEKTTDEYSRLLDWGLRLTLLLALPSALALAILAVPLISTLFHHGAFDRHDVAMTGQALVAYSVGLVGLILVKVLAPGFYARQNIRTPVKIGVLHSGRHPAHESGLHLPAAPRRSGARHRPGRLRQRRAALLQAAATSRVRAAARLGQVRGSIGGRASGDGRGAMVRGWKPGELADRLRLVAGGAPWRGRGGWRGDLLRRPLVGRTAPRTVRQARSLSDALSVRP